MLATWQVRVCLVPFDRQWSEHLAEMDALRDGIGLRAIGGRSPLAEYRREGAALFGSCQQEIRRKTVGTFFYAKITQAAEEARRVDIRARPHRSKQSRRRKP